MVLGSSTSVIAAVVTATVMMVGAAQAADDAKYPDWKGQWTRWFPPGSVPEPNGGLTAGGQPSHDQTKPWGPGQEAPLTPEYQTVYAESLADQANGGEGNFFDHSVRCMPGGMAVLIPSAHGPVFHGQRPNRCSAANWRFGPEAEIATSFRSTGIGIVLLSPGGTP